jgi:hypothetical protein
MARIDLLTAQMRQRAVSRVSISADERMKLFGEGDQLLGAGAPLSGQVIGQILSEIAPAPLDGVPVAFPYTGRDGQFEISVAPGGQSFEVRTLSFAPAQNAGAPNATAPSATVQNAPLQTHVQPQGSTPVATPVPASEPEWFYFAGDQQLGPSSAAQVKTLIRQGQIKPDTLLWSAGMTDWQAAAQTEFRTLLPVLPSSAAPTTDYFGNPVTTAAPTDSANTWFYRSATGQSVPMERAALVAKFHDKSLSPQTMVWREGMADWQIASMTELAREISGAPLPSPTGGPRPLNGGPYNVYGGGDPANNSGTGWEAQIPREARGWFNLGAFLFPTWWCRAHNLDSWATGIVVLNVASRWFFPLQIIKIPLCVGLGFMGNTIAWRMRRFNDVADFKKCQFLWGAISAAISVLMWTAFAFFIWSAMPSTTRSFSPRSTTSQSFGNGQSFGSDSGQSSGSE